MLSLQNCEKKSCSLRVKPGIPVPVDVVPVSDPTRPVRLLPDPTRTRGYGYGYGSGIPAGTGRPARLLGLQVLEEI